VNIVIFGTGLFYERRKKMLPTDSRIVAFLDNNVLKQGSIFENVHIYAPESACEMEYDAIILASSTPGEMRGQLISLEVPEEKIFYWEEYISRQRRGTLIKYRSGVDLLNKKKILIIVPLTNYTGGFLAAFNVGICFRNRGFYVVIAVPVYNEKAVEDITKSGIDVWICPSLPYITDTELEWIDAFDYVISNTLQTIICATKIKKGKKVLFWIHEPERNYEETLKQYMKYCDEDYLQEINVCTVSQLSRKIFHKHFQNINVRILPPGIEDFAGGASKNENRITIALIGNIYPLKNQIGFAEAISRLPEEKRSAIECLIIGKDVDSKYRQELDRKTAPLPCIRMIGETPMEQMHELYKEIDAVACTSREETMSMVIIEGMMCGKICITNTNTGIADYIQDGVNGYVYNEGDTDELIQKIDYVITHFGQLDQVRAKARETYERYFSMECLKKNLEAILKCQLYDAEVTE